MTFSDFQFRLQQCESLAACDKYLTENPQEIRDLFYADVDNQPAAARFDVEDALLAFLNGACGTELLQGVPPSPAVVALLIYFISFSERAGFHHLILHMAQSLPAGHLRPRAEALYKYKSITNAGTDYAARFEELAQLVTTAWTGGDADTKAQCTDMAIEYFCAASASSHGAGAANHTTLARLFKDPTKRARYPFLGAPTIDEILTLPLSRLEQEQEEANARIAKAFYDEAAVLLPVPLQEPPQMLCAATGRTHGGHCPPGFHAARLKIAAKYPTAFSQTGTFIKQSLNSRIYTPFDKEVECMRYFRQYQPLHMPQIEAAVLATMKEVGRTRKHMHILDIGGGPGSLYCVLAGLLHRGMFKQCEFEITIVEPSAPFHAFLDIIATLVNHPKLRIRKKCACRLDQLPSMTHKADVDWFFIANAITPLVAHSRSVTSAVSELCKAVTAIRKSSGQAILTIAENTSSADFPEFCNLLQNRGLTCTVSDIPCDGPWLAACQFYVNGPRRLTNPRLKYAYVPLLEGKAIQ